MSSKDFLNNQCFVIMPFTKRTLDDGKEYDFDELYREVFKEAIAKVVLPEGGNLVPKRADDTSASGIISEEMFRDILYSRIVLADITGLNPNVFYELGVRHSLRPTSTVVVKDKHWPNKGIPFDIKDNRVFDYDKSTLTAARHSTDLVAEKLQASLDSRVYDSPVYSTLNNDLIWPNYEAKSANNHFRSYHEAKILEETVQEYISEAKRAVENRNLFAAIAACKGARKIVPDSLKVNMKLGLLLRDTGGFEEAAEVFEGVVFTHPAFAVAWRELGIARNKLDKSQDAIEKLNQSVSLNEFDSDAWGALGGVYKKRTEYSKSLNAYERGFKANPKSTYTFLNYLLLFSIVNKMPPPMQAELDTALDACKRQIDLQTNTPWCYFDLANIQLLTGQPFEQTLTDAVGKATAKWEIETARKTYELFVDTNTKKSEAEAAIQIINQNLK